MSAGALPSAVTGDYSLDDFLDAGEREDPDGDDDEHRDAPAEPDDGPESASDAATPADAEPSAAPPTDDVEAESTDVDPASSDDPVLPGSVAPAEPTYGWSPDGAECAGCGESSTTRWRQDGEYVCADCKEW